jgi:hypothetical protein
MPTVVSILRRGLPLVAVVLMSAACGDGDGGDGGAGRAGGSDAGQLKAAAAATLDERSMSFDLDFDVDGAGVHQAGRLAGSGDVVANRGRVAADSGGVEARSVFDGDRFWLTSTDETFTSAMPDGKDWVAGKISELGDDGAVTRLEPLALLYVLNGAESVTAHDADGMTRYRFDVDMSAAADSAPGDRREEVAQLIEAADGRATVAGEAVVDGDQHVRALTVTGTMQTEGGEIDVKYHATLDDFDQAPRVEPPPDDEVVALADVPELSGQLGQP